MNNECQYLCIHIFLSLYLFQGLANVIPLDWLQMFSNKEFQVLISGAEIPVDLQDLKLHTNYAGIYIYITNCAVGVIIIIIYIFFLWFKGGKTCGHHRFRIKA